MTYENKRESKDSENKKKEFVRKKTGPISSLFEELIAKTTWVVFLLLRFLLKLCWNMVKGAWAGALGAKKATEVAHELVQKAVAETPLAEQSVPFSTYESANACTTVHEDEFSIFLRAFTDRIERTLKTDRQREPWMRARFAFTRTGLTPYTRADAMESNLPFTFAGAVSYTAREMNGRLPKRQVVEVREPEAEVSEPIRKSQLNDEKPSSDDSAASSVEYTGKVIAAGLVDIRPEGRPSYTTFAISIKSPTGEIVELQGVDLREKFESRQFDLYDVVHVTKSKTNFMSGKQKRTKNSFAVRVLEKAPV